MANKEESKPSLARVIAEINKKAGENIIGRISELPKIEMIRRTTGVKALDDAMGGGMPSKGIVELYGLPSAGKSLISLFVVREAQKQGLNCVYLDCEDTFDPEWATKNGVDTGNLILSQSSIGEDTLEMVLKLVQAEVDVIIVDSVAEMVTKAELEGEIGKPFMAVKARLMSSALRLIKSHNKKTLIIFINQLRSTMAMYGPQFVTPGGIALKFASSIRLEVKKIEDLRVDGKKTTDVIGQVTGCKVTKNKTAPPFKAASFKFFYEDARIEESKI